MVDSAPEIGLIGGSGLYSFFSAPARTEVEVQTPYGTTSAPISIGEVAGRRVAFIPRHGNSHQHPPHLVPYQANLWALHQLGVTKVLAACAVGSLVADQGPGTIVAPDQLVDRTQSRVQTYFERGGIHPSFADPYCSDLRSKIVAAEPTTVDGGTMVVIEGPRFSTRAESHWYAGQGWTLVNMTGHPEAVLARELKLCYAPLCLVTDLDAGIDTGDGVTTHDVFAEFESNLPRLRTIIGDTIAAIDPDDQCACAAGDHSLAAIGLTDR